MKIWPKWLINITSKPESELGKHWAVAQGAILILLCDQFTKYLIQHFLPCDPSAFCRNSFPAEGIFRLTHIHNSGSIFGLFYGFNTPLIFISFLGILVLAFIYLSQRVRGKWLRLSIALQIGGALGNVADRIRVGYVIDFIDVGISAWRWPAFNIADASIISGLCILVMIIMASDGTLSRRRSNGLTDVIDSDQ